MTNSEGAPSGAKKAPQAGDVEGAVVPESDGVGSSLKDAAPVLYEALEELLFRLSDMSFRCTDKIGKAEGKARDALKMARGEKP